MILSLGSDHAGYDYREIIKNFLEKEGHQVMDHGAYSTESIDYPDSAHDIIAGRSSYGILLCGTANGMTMTANKYKEIRAGLTWLPEIAGFVREHNDANVLCIPARYATQSDAIEIVRVFLEAAFAGGRNIGRIEKMCCSI